MFLNEPPHSHGGRRGKGAHAARESPAKRLDRANPCGGERLCEIGVSSVLFPPFHEVTEANGIHLQEGMTFEGLVESGAWVFAYVFAPLPIVGATCSPGNPIATL